MEKLEPARWKPKRKPVLPRDRVVCQGVAKRQDIKKMVKMAVGLDDTVEQPVVDVPPRLSKRAGTQINDDARRPAFDQLTATALTRVWPGRTATQHGELHALQFLSVRAVRMLVVGIVPEPASE
jgi:hypothetical protein